MSNKKTLSPSPMFEGINDIDSPPACVMNFLDNNSVKNAQQEYHLALEFLKSYMGSLDTFTAYRREVERLVQWAWCVAKKPLQAMDRNDIRDYIHFVQSPPPQWVGTKTVARYKIDENGLKQFNPDWRPFVVRIPKSQIKAGLSPSTQDYRMSNKSLQSVFAGISTFFTFLMQDNYVVTNPVMMVRQKTQFIQSEQQQKVTRKLSHTQWQYVIETALQQAQEDPDSERSLFILSAFYLLGLRISELAETPGRIPTMGDFAPDKHGLWWFTTVGKGNKVRDVAVPDEMLSVLKRYREARGLPSLPMRGEQAPLIHKNRGKGGLGTRQIRNIVQSSFDQAVHRLQNASENDQAQDLMAATVHWLRHTSISADVEFRPREHVRDDAGHENANITDKYIDTDRVARHESAQKKKLT